METNRLSMENSHLSVENDRVGMENMRLRASLRICEVLMLNKGIPLSHIIAANDNGQGQKAQPVTGASSSNTAIDLTRLPSATGYFPMNSLHNLSEALRINPRPTASSLTLLFLRVSSPRVHLAPSSTNRPSFSVTCSTSRTICPPTTFLPLSSRTFSLRATTSTALAPCLLLRSLSVSSNRVPPLWAAR